MATSDYRSSMRVPCRSESVLYVPKLAAIALLLLVISTADTYATTVAVSLDAEANPTSKFITYWSEGIAQLNMTYPGTNNQPFWNTNNLSQSYNSSFDFFPNDSAMKFGELTYDDSDLVAGSGTAPIAGLTLGIETNPLDPAYVNGSWLSFTTELESFSGNVTVVDGTVTQIDLTANYTSSGYFGSLQIDATGTFTIVGDQFEVSASGLPNTFLGPYDPPMIWDWTGMILDLSGPSDVENGDFNGDGTVDAADYNVWRNSLGATELDPFALGDANGDGQVATADYHIWKSQFGGPPPSSSPSASLQVPEPAGAMSALVAAFAIGIACKFSTIGQRI